MLAPLAMLGTWEMVIIGVVALLVFGKRLPDVARSLGRGVVEFKKGLRGIEDEIDAGATAAPRRELPAAEKAPLEPVGAGAKAPAAVGQAAAAGGASAAEGAR